MSRPSEDGLTPRHWIALTALISGVVATYLHLWKLGLTGPLVCTGNQGCEIAQFSNYGWFLGVDVALIGAVGYTAIFVTAMLGVQPRWIHDRRTTRILALLVYPAILFTLRLKYGEFVVLKTFCPWCAVSAVTITLHGVLVWRDWVRVNGFSRGREAVWP